MAIKRYRNKNVLDAARERIKIVFDNFERVYCAFSGGKDSSVMLHLVMEEAIARGTKVAVMYIDFEAQYKNTIDHVKEMFGLYKEHIEPHWICAPMLLRNALTNFEPQWVCWDEDKKDIWIRKKPEEFDYKTSEDYPFMLDKMEFEEFITLFAQWYGQEKRTAGFIGIRADESLHRYCTIATWQKKDLLFQGHRWTTKIVDECYNVYPIYDWRTEDIWKYHAKHPDKPHNKIYDKMQMAGVKLSQQRLCQPFGDDQRRGLWLYHILEPETWFKLVNRVNGANSGALYVRENGNVTGYNKIQKPEHHTWRSFCNLLLQTMPKKTRDHYVYRFQKFIYGWRKRGYQTIPEESPPELESKCWAPSWRRMCKVLLRNDYWCKGLGQTQPKSEAYQKFKEMKKQNKKEQSTKSTTSTPRENPLLIDVRIGDSREVLKEFPDGHFNLIMTSPPYADARKDQYGGVPPSEYPDWFATFSDGFWRVLADDGSFIFNIKDKVIDGVRDRYVWKTILKLSELGWKCIDDFIWHKPNPVPGQWGNCFKDGWEYCFHLAKSTDIRIFKDAVRVPLSHHSETDKRYRQKAPDVRENRKTGSGMSFNDAALYGLKDALPSNVVTVPLVGRDEGHPAVYPDKLPEFFVKLFTKKKDKVLDPFAGSGTTGVVCKRLQRECVLIEKEEKYHRVIKGRLRGKQIKSKPNEDKREGMRRLL